MTTIQAWPVYFAQELILGNRENNVAVCSLWTPRERLAAGLDSSRYAVIGNLYSLWGINYVVRNVLANPRIRHLVVCGSERSGTGAALLELLERGVDESHAVPGRNLVLDRSVPREDIESFRRGVRAYDLRGERDPVVVARLIATLEPLPPFAEPKTFPDIAARAPMGMTFPSEETGFKVTEDTVAQAWLRVLRAVLRFGVFKPSETASEQRELLNVMAVIRHEDPNDPYLPEWLSLSKEMLDRYYLQLLDAQDPAQVEREVSYTYGDRLRAYRGRLDQIETMVQRLKETPHTRRAVAVTWDPETDAASENPPCLTQINASIQRDRLYLTAHFRSHDVLNAWPANALALRRLQGELARQVGMEIGPLTILSHSAHIYRDRIPASMPLMRDRYPRTLEWEDDPRGNFLISLEEGKIVAEHATTERGRTGMRFEGTTAKQVYNQIVNQQFVSLHAHAAYLGAELTKAELALAYDLPYVQDGELLRLPMPLRNPDQSDTGEGPNA